MTMTMGLFFLLVSTLVSFVFAQKHDAAGQTHFKQEYLHLVEMAVTGSLFDETGSCDMGSPGGCSRTYPYKPDEREGGNDWPAVGHTMVGHKRLHNIKELLTDVVANDIPGDFVELGVWRGGACIYARVLLNVLHQPNRHVHLFDAFESLPGYDARSNYLANTMATVEHNFEKYNLKEGFTFHKGLFKDSVPPFSKEFKGNISVLRVDGNFYDSYQDAMYFLYDKVPVGGYVIFDDIWSHDAVQRFWKEYKAEQNIQEDFTRIDVHSAYFKKTHAIVTDFKYFRPPQDANK